METTAEVWKPGVKLRPYQEAACEAVWKAFSERGVRRGGVCMPTGAGKTVTASVFVTKIVKKYGSNCLWVAHRKELLDQAEKAFKRVDPTLRITRWDADEKDDSGDIVLCMIGSSKTLSRKFLLVVIDEGHHAAIADPDEDDYENLYTKLLGRVQWSHLIGLTATPQRLDGRALALDELVYSVRFLDLVRKHRLSRPIYVEMTTDQKALLQIRGGEFTKQSLQTLDNPDRNGKIADEYVKNKAKYGKTLMFVTSVQHCETMRDAILARDPSVEIMTMTGKDTRARREEVQAWFSQGGADAQKVLINCEIYTEGYDEPTIRSVFLTRPTMSKGLWLQMVGRGARIVTADTQVCTHDIVKRELAGDDGVEKYTFSNGIEYYGEDLGVAYVADDGTEVRNLRLQTDNEFFLVNVMDDITKFHALVEEWQLDVRELTKEEIEVQELSTKINQKRLQMKVLKDIDVAEQDQKLDSLSDAQVRDLVGILVVSTYYHKNIGIPCDFERTAVLKRLMDFARDECIVTEKQKVTRTDPQTGAAVTVEEEVDKFDADKYKDAYTWCISQAEFPKSIFEIIRVAYYFRYIQGRQRVRYQNDQQYYETWKFIPLTDITPESRQRHMEKANDLAQQSKTLNETFNTTYDTQEKQRALVQRVYEAVNEIEGLNTAAKRRITGVIPSLHIVRVRDRKITMFSSLEVGGPRDAGRISKTAHTLTVALQQVLDDPGALVTISPKRSTWDSTGDAIGAAG